MPTTSNFGWTTPADTDLVKDGAAAIRTLGNGIDTSLVDLKGGTTGQILSKASNADLDYTWINNDQGDITAVVAGTGLSGGGTTGSVTLTNTVATAFDAAGDLVYGTGADTFTRLGLGTAGQVLTVNSGATAPQWTTPTSGGYTLLASGSHSGSTLSLTSISGSYVDLYLILDNIDVSTGTFLRLRFNGDTNENRHRAWSATLDGGAFSFTSGDISATFHADSSSNSTCISIPNYTNTNSWKFASSRSFGVNSANTAQWSWAEFKVGYNQTSAITQLDIIQSSAGSFTCGYKLYGVK